MLMNLRQIKVDTSYYRQIRKIRENSKPRGREIKGFTNPRVSYPFIYYKLLKSLGKERIVNQIKSVKKLSDDVFLVDYNSDDGIKDICKECGIPYHNVKKTKGIKFHISKCFNRAIFESKYRYVVPVNFDCIYPYNFSMFIELFFKKHDPSKHLLFVRMLDLDEKGKIYERGGAVTIYHRPSIIKARGWDERIGGGLRSYVDRYIVIMMEYSLGMKTYIHPTYYVLHRKHDQREIVQETITFDFVDQLKGLKRNIKKFRKNVRNSYW